MQKAKAKNFSEGVGKRIHIRWGFLTFMHLFSQSLLKSLKFISLWLLKNLHYANLIYYSVYNVYDFVTMLRKSENAEHECLHFG